MALVVASGNKAEQMESEIKKKTERIFKLCHSIVLYYDRRVYENTNVGLEHR
jgi:hypothetical protein